MIVGAASLVLCAGIGISFYPIDSRLHARLRKVTEGRRRRFLKATPTI
jgi:hypothetical protein